MTATESTSAPRVSRYLTVADVARERGVHRDTARRWLKRLDRRTKGKVLVRMSDARGSKMYTTHARLLAADPGWLEQRVIDRDEVLALKKRVAAVEKENRALKSKVRELLVALGNAIALQQSAAKCGRGGQLPK